VAKHKSDDGRQLKSCHVTRGVPLVKLLTKHERSASTFMVPLSAQILGLTGNMSPGCFRPSGVLTGLPIYVALGHSSQSRNIVSSNWNSS
jgi:hypothetical protein